MRLVVVIFWMVCCALGSTAPRVYSFSILGVSDPGGAKEACVVLEHLFDVRPVFHDASDRFTVSSEALLNEDKLRRKLAVHGFVLGDFAVISEKDLPGE